MAERFNLRFPDGLRDKLTAAAKENKRSRNAEIIQRLARVPDKAYQPQGSIVVVTRGSDQTIVSMPSALHAELTASAALSGRSLQSECVFRLVASFDESAAPQAAEPRPAIFVGPTKRELASMRRRVAELLSDIDEMIARADA